MGDKLIKLFQTNSLLSSFFSVPKLENLTFLNIGNASNKYHKLCIENRPFNYNHHYNHHKELQLHYHRHTLQSSHHHKFIGN